jgi:hypothetical protein
LINRGARSDKCSDAINNRRCAIIVCRASAIYDSVRHRDRQCSRRYRAGGHGISSSGIDLDARDVFGSTYNQECE